MSTEPPLAKTVPQKTRSLAWIVPAATLIVVGLLAYDAWRAPGIDVTVRLDEGHGVGPGAAVRYRGVEVGRVRSVALTTDLSGVELLIRLGPDAVPLAREGSRFWVERARIGSGEVRGLDTLLGGPYLAVRPGPAGTRATRTFHGLERPPLDTGDGAGLEVIVEAPRRGGVAVGAPVNYRQMAVGRVLSVGLASDAGAVEMRLWIEPEYAPLVRAGTRFWESSGVSFRAGWLEGLDLSLDSLEALLAGGIAFATPPDGGAPVRTGQRFPLHPAPDARWLEWRPGVAVGGEGLPGGAPVRPLRAALSVDRGMLWTSRRTVGGWILPIDGRLLGPADLFHARGDNAVLEVEGVALGVAGASAAERGLASIEAGPVRSDGWPRGRRRALAEPEDVVLVADRASEPVAIAAARLVPVRSRDGAIEAWDTGGIALDGAEWHGALVLARADGALVGLLLAREQRPRIAPLPASLLAP